METASQETKLENLRVHATAKGKLREVQERIQAKRGPHAKLPTLTETLMELADRYLSTAA